VYRNSCACEFSQPGLTAAARKIGVATYQTALPDPKLIRARLEHLTSRPHQGKSSASADPVSAGRQLAG